MARVGGVAIRTFPWLVLLLTARTAHALTWSVAPGGDDANPGTTAEPFKTLQRAADLVEADDTVFIEPGTYTGFSLCYDHPQNGTQDSPITFMAKPGVIIDAPNAKTPDGINLEGCSYIILDGFEVHGMPRAGIRTVSGDMNAIGVTIRNNYCHDNATWGIFTSHVDSLLIENNRATNSQTQHGIYVSNACVSPVVRGNELAGNAGAGLHMNGDATQGGTGIITGALVEKNVIHDNGLMGGSGINCDGVQSSRIRNNLIYAEHASGISLYQGDAAKAATGNVVVNNTVIVASDGRWAVNIQNASTGNTVVDNILLNDNPMHGSIDVSADSLTNLTSDYNIVLDRFTPDDNDFVTLADWRTMTKQDAHSLIATAGALFVNVAGGDYHLLATAPAVGAGTTTDAPADDLEGTPRAGQDDIGAYQQCCKPDGGTGGSGGRAGADGGAGDGTSSGAGAASDGAGAASDGAVANDAASPDGGVSGASGAGGASGASGADAGGSAGGGSSGGCGCATRPLTRAPPDAAWPLFVMLTCALLGARRRP